MSRWIRLAAAVVAMIQISNLQYAWSPLVEPLRAAHPDWTLDGVQWGFTIFIALETWAMAPSAWLLGRFGERLVFGVAGVMCLAGWAMLGVVGSLPLLYLCYGLAGFGAAIVYTGCIGVALRWFPDRRGLAAGLIASGFGSGSALFSYLMLWLRRDYGYAEAFLYSGIVHGSLIIAAGMILAIKGSAAGPAMGAAKAAAVAMAQDFTPSEMLRTKHFRMMFAMMLMMGMGGIFITANVNSVGKTMSIGAGALALAGVIMPIANGSGRFFWGSVSDWLGREKTMAIAFLIQALALAGVMLLGTSSDAIFLTLMALVFFTWGQIYALFPAACGAFFGSKHASKNYPFLYMTKGIAGFFPAAGAWLFRVTGTWEPAFYGCAGLALTACVMAVILKGMPAPVKPQASAMATAISS